MAYMSKDKNFMADYDSGRDVYMELNVSSLAEKSA